MLISTKKEARNVRWPIDMGKYHREGVRLEKLANEKDIESDLVEV